MKLDDDVYWWAHRECEKLTTIEELERINLANIKKFYIRDDQHTALFHKDGAKYALLRFLNYPSGNVVYKQIDNYKDIVIESPDIVNMLLLTGKYIYEKANMEITNGRDMKIIHIDFIKE